LIEPVDYPELCQWWESWGWKPIPAEFLPPTGIMVYNETGNVCAGWLYKTDTPIAWFENCISSKSASRADRDGGLDLLVETGCRIANDHGFRVVMTALTHNGLKRRFLKHGFMQSDDGVSHFIKGVF
jgi:hypothetical protein